jgi:hypothetical protein
MKKNLVIFIVSIFILPIPLLAMEKSEDTDPTTSFHYYQPESEVTKERALIITGPNRKEKTLSLHFYQKLKEIINDLEDPTNFEQLDAHGQAKTATPSNVSATAPIPLDSEDTASKPLKYYGGSTLTIACRNDDWGRHLPPH